MKRPAFCFFLLVTIVAIQLGVHAPSVAQAQPAVRAEVAQHGDFTLIGNIFGQDCSSGVPAPVAGTVGNCGTNTSDTAPDVFWQASNGLANANNSIEAANASSTAVLNLPPGAQVTHAYLYWAGTLSDGALPDTSATLDRPGTALNATITAEASFSQSSTHYASVADVTALVQQYGAGAYRVSHVDLIDWRNLNNDTLLGSWWMVVLYRQDSEPLRLFTLLDGLEYVSNE
jgi:hypothetical protein